MFVYTKHLTLHLFFFAVFFFFPAYAFQSRPHCGGTTTILHNAPFINPTPGADHIEDYFSGGETEEEWLDDSQLTEVSPQFLLRPEGNKVRFHLTLYHFNS
jgi:hypothetical protein